MREPSHPAILMARRFQVGTAGSSACSNRRKMPYLCLYRKCSKGVPQCTPQLAESTHPKSAVLASQGMGCEIGRICKPLDTNPDLFPTDTDCRRYSSVLVAV